MSAPSLVRGGGERPTTLSLLPQQPGGSPTARGLGCPPYPRSAGRGAAATAPAKDSPHRGTPPSSRHRPAPAPRALRRPPQRLPCPLTPRPGRRRRLPRSPPPARSRPGAADAVNMADGRVRATSRGRERRAGAGGGLSSAAAPPLPASHTAGSPRRVPLRPRSRRASPLVPRGPRRRAERRGPVSVIPHR